MSGREKYPKSEGPSKWPSQYALAVFLLIFFVSLPICVPASRQIASDDTTDNSHTTSDEDTATANPTTEPSTPTQTDTQPSSLTSSLNEISNALAFRDAEKPGTIDRFSRLLLESKASPREIIDQVFTGDEAAQKDRLAQKLSAIVKEPDQSGVEKLVQKLAKFVRDNKAANTEPEKAEAKPAAPKSESKGNDKKNDLASAFLDPRNPLSPLSPLNPRGLLGSLFKNGNNQQGSNNGNQSSANQSPFSNPFNNFTPPSNRSRNNVDEKNNANNNNDNKSNNHSQDLGAAALLAQQQNKGQSSDNQDQKKDKKDQSDFQLPEAKAPSEDSSSSKPKSELTNATSALDQAKNLLSDPANTPNTATNASSGPQDPGTVPPVIPRVQSSGPSAGDNSFSGAMASSNPMSMLGGGYGGGSAAPISAGAGGDIDVFASVGMQAAEPYGPPITKYPTETTSGGGGGSDEEGGYEGDGNFPDKPQAQTAPLVSQVIELPAGERNSPNGKGIMAYVGRELSNVCESKASRKIEICLKVR